MKKIFMGLGGLAPLTTIPLAISCSQTSHRTEAELQKEKEILEKISTLGDNPDLMVGVNRIDFDFEVMRSYGVSEWCFRKNADGTWNNSLRVVAIALWKHLNFNITPMSDKELDAFVESAPSNLHEIEQNSNMRYTDILNSKMNAPLDFWIDKMKMFFEVMVNRSSSMLQDNNKIILRETIDKSSTVLKEIIL